MSKIMLSSMEEGLNVDSPISGRMCLLAMMTFVAIPGLMDGGNIKSKSLGVKQKKSGTT